MVKAWMPGRSISAHSPANRHPAGASLRLLLVFMNGCHEVLQAFTGPTRSPPSKKEVSLTMSMPAAPSPPRLRSLVQRFCGSDQVCYNFPRGTQIQPGMKLPTPVSTDCRLSRLVRADSIRVRVVFSSGSRRSSRVPWMFSKDWQRCWSAGSAFQGRLCRIHNPQGARQFLLGAFERGFGLCQLAVYVA